jgi:hypothetical protein
MEQIIQLNDLRLSLKSKEKELSTCIYLLGEEEKKETLDKCVKERKKVQKMIFALIKKQ